LFATLQEANLHVEYYVFYDNNLTGVDNYQIYASIDEILARDVQLMQNDFDGGGSVTVGALPKEVFNTCQMQLRFARWTESPQCRSLASKRLCQ